MSHHIVINREVAQGSVFKELMATRGGRETILASQWSISLANKIVHYYLQVTLHTQSYIISNTGNRSHEGFRMKPLQKITGNE
jgi:hypothetical protein